MKFIFLCLSCVVFAACAAQPKPEVPAKIMGPPVADPPPVSEPAAQPAPAPAPKPAQIWRLKKGKLHGSQPAAKLLSEIKNIKTPGVTTEKCWPYRHFAIVEMKSTDEVGSAEILIRYPGEAKNLCAKDFKSATRDLKIIEGHFVGVVGDFILVDGDDASEGMIEFQAFSVSDGREAFKSHHHPNEDFTITLADGKVALTYFAKVKAKCELAREGETCWQQILHDNSLPKTPMPNCKGLTESVLVTTKARVADLAKPKLEWLGGRATCAPEP